MTKSKIITQDLSDQAIKQLANESDRRIEAEKSYRKAICVVRNTRYELKEAWKEIKDISGANGTEAFRIKIDSMNRSLQIESQILDSFLVKIGNITNKKDEIEQAISLEGTMRGILREKGMDDIEGVGDFLPLF